MPPARAWSLQERQGPGTVRVLPKRRDRCPGRRESTLHGDGVNRGVPGVSGLCSPAPLPCLLHLALPLTDISPSLPCLGSGEAKPPTLALQVAKGPSWAKDFGSPPGCCHWFRDGHWAEDKKRGQRGTAGEAGSHWAGRPGSLRGPAENGAACTQRDTKPRGQERPCVSAQIQLRLKLVLCLLAPAPQANDIPLHLSQCELCFDIYYGNNLTNEAPQGKTR